MVKMSRMRFQTRKVYLDNQIKIPREEDRDSNIQVTQVARYMDRRSYAMKDRWKKLGYKPKKKFHKDKIGMFMF